MNDLTLIGKNLTRKKLRAGLMIFSIAVALAIFGVLGAFERAFYAGQDMIRQVGRWIVEVVDALRATEGQGDPATEARIRNVTNAALTPEQQRRQLDLLQSLNAEQLARTPGDAELEAVIGSFDLGNRIQTHAPGVPGQGELGGDAGQHLVAAGVAPEYEVG